MTPLFLVTFGRSFQVGLSAVSFLHFVGKKDAADPNAGSKAAFQPNKHI